MAVSLSCPGVYAIRNHVNEKCYVGSALNLKRRFIQHRAHLRGQRHHNQHLQRAWNKYGEAAFYFEPLLLTGKGDLLKFEQMLLDTLDDDRLYNQNPTAGSRLGAKVSEETRRKLRESHLGQSRPQSEEHRRKIGIANLGKVRSQEIRKQIGDMQRGKPKLFLRGQNNGQSKLTENQIRSIRKDTRSQETIGKEYGVSGSHVYNIRNRKSWSWLED